MDLNQIARELLRLNGKSVHLMSGKKIELELLTGGKLAKEIISHDELSRILFDGAPESAKAAIRAGRGPAPFVLSVGGSSFKVEIEAFRNSWSVCVAREEADDANVIDFESMSFNHATVRNPAPVVAPNDRTQPGRVADLIPSPRDGGARSALALSGENPHALPQSLSGRAGEAAERPSVATLPAPPWAEPETPKGVPAAVSGAAPADRPGSDSSSVSSMPTEGQSISVSQLARAEPEIDAILRKLVTDNGSDVHLTAGQAPRYRIGGNIQLIPGFGVLSEEQLRRMLFQIMPARIRTEYEETRDADFAHAIEGVSRFRVNVGVDRHGSYSVIRRIPFEIMSPEQIGLPKKVLDLCWLTKGLVLVTGPTGSGKSTTLATLIDFINSNRQDHIIIVEDPIEFVHPDTKKCLIRQREVGEHTSSFKRALKAALREDPDIVLVGELRDLETIAIAIETAETGHLVFGTLHTSTAPSTVDRVIDQFPAHQQDQIRVMLSESLKGVVAQTLCKRIGGGRVAAYEVLLGTKAVSNLIREGKTYQIYSMMQTSKQAGMVTLNESLFQLLRNRVITPEEAFMKSVEKEEFRNMLDKAGIRVKLNSLIDDL